MRAESDQLTAEREKVRVLSDALKFYADKDNYNSEGAPCNDRPCDDNGYFPHEYDIGEIARQALEKVNNGNG